MKLRRRQLLVNTTKILTAISASSVLTFPIITSASGETEFLSLSDEQVKTLNLLSRSMFPHESLDDSYYLAVTQSIGRKISAKAGLKELVEDGVKQLNVASEDSWLELSSTARNEIMTNIDKSPFFAFVLNTSIDVLYRHPDVWKLIGYEGSSIEHGGYLHRGFDDIDWLPQ